MRPRIEGARAQLPRAAAVSPRRKRTVLWIFVLVCGAVAPALTSRSADGGRELGLHSFRWRCGEMGCARADVLCKDVRGCAKNTEEIGFLASKRAGGVAPTESGTSRARRQAACSEDQWRCRDGACVRSDGKCDGARDCADGSDETHALCRGTTCASGRFRCTYGACVDETAACDGVRDCADGSDELQPRCSNETDEVGGKFKCQHGPPIAAPSRCDGVTDCPDGSDERLRACAGVRCPSYTFQCAYGACVDQGSKCDGKRDCPDGSDEDAELCGRTGAPSAAPAQSENGSCKLPAYPEHGRYVVSGKPDADPEDALEEFTLRYSCDTGYGIVGKDSVSCSNGHWSYGKPQCLRLCRLDSHQSVEYLCPEPGSNATRVCERTQPSGAQVFPQCKSPNYYTRQSLSPMRCMEGSWDYIAICKPDCGRVTTEDPSLLSLRQLNSRNELPWHVRVYRKKHDSYRQICSGSIISATIVVSAAHCYCDGEGRVQPATRFAVAAAKTYQAWDDARDYDTQTSDVAEIKIPSLFRGAQTNFQNNIALLVLSTPLTYETYVRPICIDFDESFERQQLQRGSSGKLASRVYTPKGTAASKSLKVVELPYVDSEECLTRFTPSFRKYVTNDKICAGYTNDTILCTRDNGGGLAFPDAAQEEMRYYLRGVLSISVNRRKSCNPFPVASFTSIARHEYFIKEHIDPSLIGRITESGPCRLPPYPSHGGYAVAGRPDARPGDTFEAFFLNYTCDAGYGIVGKNEIYCFNGYWPAKSPYCIECGLETPVGQPLIIDGAPVERAELPWHVGVYRKNNTNSYYEQICGGTIVSTTIVVSAAHCFWNDVEKLQPASRFAVAAGKLHRAWNSPHDAGAQTSDIAEIKIPSRFRGVHTNFQDDVALLVLATPLAYQTYVRPVCVDFDEQFEKKQLQQGYVGKVAGWGYTSEHGLAADTLRVALLPYVDVDSCLAQAPPSFYQYITSDKICAGYTNGTALCRGDSGGGLVFPKTSRKVTRYFLRGVVSTAPNNERACNAYAITGFTQISKQASFIRRNL